MCFIEVQLVTDGQTDIGPWLVVRYQQDRRQEMKWGVFLQKKWKMEGVLLKKVENEGVL